jgi:diguanylate cyclase (GGDEF)-like protein
VDTAARFGGDEFVLLLREVKQKQDAIKIAQKVLESLSRPIEIGENIARVTTSIGIAMYPDDGSEINVLIKKSDDAMYRVKENGRNNYQFFC